MGQHVLAQIHFVRMYAIQITTASIRQKKRVHVGGVVQGNNVADYSVSKIHMRRFVVVAYFTVVTVARTLSLWEVPRKRRSVCVPRLVVTALQPYAHPMRKEGTRVLVIHRVRRTLQVRLRIRHSNVM